MDKLKTGGVIGAFAGLIILATFLAWKWIDAKAIADKYLQDNSDLSWRITTLKAEKDSIKGLGEYSPQDTIWPDPLPPEIIYRDSVTVDSFPAYPPIPKIIGHVTFDTTQIFGEDSSLSVQVKGKIYYPNEFKWRNWLQIIPDWRKPPVTPLTARSPKRWGIGLACAISSRQEAYLGLGGRFNRTSVALYRQVDQNVWMAGLEYRIF